jgi:hypothetical protein
MKPSNSLPLVQERASRVSGAPEGVPEVEESEGDKRGEMSEDEKKPEHASERLRKKIKGGTSGLRAQVAELRSQLDELRAIVDERTSFLPSLSMYHANDLILLEFKERGGLVRGLELLEEKRRVPHEVVGGKRLVVPKDAIEMFPEHLLHSKMEVTDRDDGDYPGHREPAGRGTRAR